MVKTVKERLRWLQLFMPLYEKVVPLIRGITDLKSLESGELPVSPHALAESPLTLKPVLESIRKIPKPKEKELLSIKREFEIVLSSCIKAGESATNYIKLDGQGMKGQIQLSTIINSLVLANEYMESVSKKLAPLLEG